MHVTSGLFKHSSYWKSFHLTYYASAVEASSRENFVCFGYDMYDTCPKQKSKKKKKQVSDTLIYEMQAPPCWHLQMCKLLLSIKTYVQNKISYTHYHFIDHFNDIWPSYMSLKKIHLYILRVKYTLIV